ncbi:Hsp20/alpha crystallin family protein [Pedobacter jamesrossensis]|uniref:Hsp20/alpha crystallin family protein n=1 Tax=Pedobacter jamesrossensis TaxID=1908238 RepID=A0ABV8NJT4_9SPHI
MYNENRCHNGKMDYRGFGPRGRFGGRHGRFTQHAQEMFGAAFRKVPANIEDTEDSFIVHVFAPALVKEHLKVVTKDDVLTISYSPKDDDNTKEKFSRKEYSNGAFERAFALNGKVITESISASYTDGILKVTLPKNPETNTPAKNIQVD